MRGRARRGQCGRALGPAPRPHRGPCRLSGLLAEGAEGRQAVHLHGREPRPAGGGPPGKLSDGRGRAARGRRVSGPLPPPPPPPPPLLCWYAQPRPDPAMIAALLVFLAFALVGCLRAPRRPSEG